MADTLASILVSLDSGSSEDGHLRSAENEAEFKHEVRSGKRNENVSKEDCKYGVALDLKRLIRWQLDRHACRW